MGWTRNWLLVTLTMVALLLGMVRTSWSAIYELPLVWSADNPTMENFIRIQGKHSSGGFIRFQRLQIQGIDDTGKRSGPVWLIMRHSKTLILTASDLEQGNTEKGLPVGLGPSEGPRRILLTADDEHLDIRAYVRNLPARDLIVPIHPLAPVYDRVPGRPRPRHVVPALRPVDTEGTTVVRIFNRKPHPVRLKIGSNLPLMWERAECLIPPFATVVKTGEDLWELLTEESWLTEADIQDRQQEEWDLWVEIWAEPTEPPSHAMCQVPGPEETDKEPEDGGEAMDIGVLVLHEDQDGYMTNLSGRATASIGTRRTPRPSPSRWRGFDITVEFGEGFNAEWRAAIMHSVKRWEQLIVADYPSLWGDLSDCGFPGPRRRVDDLLVRFEWRDHQSARGSAMVCIITPTTGFPWGRPVAGVVFLDSSEFDTERVHDFLSVDGVVQHEIGHVLGIGTLWERSSYLQLSGDRPAFTGPHATAAFARVNPVQSVEARKRGVQGVPVEDDGHHWRDTPYAVDGADGTYLVMGDIMGPGGSGPITAITLGALEDLGYTVAYEQLWHPDIQ